MKTIAERILEIVEDNGGNMSSFARRIDLTPAYISKLKNEPNRIPSERTIADICKEFNVNPKWLREGKLPKYLPDADEETAYINDLLEDTDNPFYNTIRAILRVYAGAKPADQEALKRFAKSFLDETKKENQD